MELFKIYRYPKTKCIYIPLYTDGQYMTAVFNNRTLTSNKWQWTYLDDPRLQQQQKPGKLKQRDRKEIIDLIFSERKKVK